MPLLLLVMMVFRIKSLSWKSLLYSEKTVLSIYVGSCVWVFVQAQIEANFLCAFVSACVYLCVPVNLCVLFMNTVCNILGWMTSCQIKASALNLCCQLIIGTVAETFFSRSFVHSPDSPGLHSGGPFSASGTIVQRKFHWSHCAHRCQ